MSRGTPRLECDGCRTTRQGKPDQPLADLRERLAEVGWWSDHANDRDYCPTCTVPQEAWPC